MINIFFHVFFRFWTLSDFPRRAHRLVDEPVCGLVSDEELLVGIEMQRAVQAQGACPEVHERGAAVSLELVEGERLAVAHACQEIGVLRFGVGHFGDLLHDVGNRALKP